MFFFFATLGVRLNGANYLWRGDRTIWQEFKGQTEQQEKKIELLLLEELLEHGRVHSQEEEPLTLVLGMRRQAECSQLSLRKVL